MHTDAEWSRPLGWACTCSAHSTGTDSKLVNRQDRDRLLPTRWILADNHEFDLQSNERVRKPGQCCANIVRILPRRHLVGCQSLYHLVVRNTHKH